MKHKIFVDFGAWERKKWFWHQTNVEKLLGKIQLPLENNIMALENALASIECGIAKNVWKKSKKYVFLHFLGETSWNSSKIAFSTFPEHPLWHFIYQKCFKSLLKSSKKHYYLHNSILTFPTPLYTHHWSNMVNLG